MIKNLKLKIQAGRGDRLSTIRSIAVELEWALKDAFPGSTIQYVAEPVLATLGNIYGPGTGSADIGISFPLGAMWAYDERFDVSHAEFGTGKYKKKMKNLRALASFAHLSWYPFAVRVGTGITSIKDIKEKKYPLRLLTTPVLDLAGYSSAVVTQLLDAYGIPAESIKSWGGKILGRGWAECEALKNKQADAIFCENPPYNTRMFDLTTNCDLRFLPISDEVIKYLHDKYGLNRAVIPKGFWRGVQEDTQTIGRFNVVFIVRDDMPDEIAYELAKLTREVVSLRVPKHIPGGYLAAHTPDYVCTGTGIPLHPGAEKYYRQAGLKPTLEVPTDPEYWRKRFEKYAGGF